MFSNGRGFVLVMLFLAGVINYLDRSALSVAAPFIQEDLHISPAQMGMLFSSFFIGYAIFNFIGGWASDKYGAKHTLSAAMVVWSVFSGAIALTYNFVSLFIIRVIFGMGEGPLSAATSKAVNDWFPKKERARALGMAMCGTPLGGAVSGPIVGLIAVRWGWKASFVLIMLIGLVWTWFWIKFIKDRPDTSQSAAAEKEKNLQKGAGIPLSFYLKQPTVLFTAFAFFSYNYILFFFLTWFPSYLTTARGLSIHDMSIATIIPWVVGFIGLALGGFISDYIFSITGKQMFSRKAVLVVCLLVAAVCIGFAGVVTTAAGAVALVALSVFFLYVTGITYWAIIQDIVHPDRVGGVGGFMHFLANTSGIIGPTVTGFIVEYTGAFTSAFLLAGGLAVAGSLSVAFFVKPIKADQLPQSLLSEEHFLS
ncbi:hexuronate transporter [Bacillus glycinifermentans]|uniref:Hexuronate transporter n=1 Tax=Bacillus glycinifermentans TaxID=1664069 RepID=A0A0J6ED20_9BACI|nr:MFS transporter [Bacillus glycinifermentans]ATH95655.1 MFS transporter [Bacillus glycinifermentans]KMM54544.1 hexuronate transporter [Bacillus glycinifermentans]KRT91362.1 hexuronate transporter [Bacillus glycinifermentans]MEC0487080.1 MFS transporter [Bacillus glycinifermentans]MEC0493089.1 MFS transporter [Bacillus glycinifermentans]